MSALNMGLKFSVVINLTPYEVMVKTYHGVKVCELCTAFETYHDAVSFARAIAKDHPTYEIAVFDECTGEEIQY